jgi:hypothetical protein
MALALWSPWFHHPTLEDARLIPTTITSTWNPPLTDADHIVHKFASMITQAKSMDDVIFIESPWWSWDDVAFQLRGLNPGGVVFIQGDLKRFDQWFLMRGWMKFPYMWRNYYMYKKPRTGRLFLVKSA